MINCRECMYDAPYLYCCKLECNENEFCRQCNAKCKEIEIKCRETRYENNKRRL